MLIGLCKLSFGRSQIEFPPEKTSRNNHVELGTKSFIFIKIITFNSYNRRTLTEAFVIRVSAFFSFSVSLSDLCPCLLTMNCFQLFFNPFISNIGLPRLCIQIVHSKMKSNEKYF